VEIWLPAAGWNGRYLGTGNGGYPRTFAYRDMIEGLAAGYAVANTDMGLASAAPQGAAADVTEAFVGRPYLMLDFGSRSTHEMTVLAKAVIQTVYDAPPLKSYFIGCSTGGMQAFSEIQRYPQDYDGVVAGAPGQNRGRIHLALLWDFMAVWRRPERVLSEPQLARMTQAVLDACGDGRPYLNAPLECRWRPEAILCGHVEGVCLTPEQAAAAQMIYDGPRNPRTGEVYLAGLPRGSEAGWAAYMRAADGDMPFAGVFRFALGAGFDPLTFDWDRDATTFLSLVAPYFDAMETDFEGFFGRGGKLIVYHGGADPLAPVEDTVTHVAALSAIAQQSGSTRLFVLPGVGHCGGGAGPDRFDRLTLIRNWVEEGKAPETIMAASVSDPAMSRQIQATDFQHRSSDTMTPRSDPK
jgi:feruloyl esterase